MSTKRKPGWTCSTHCHHAIAHCAMLKKARLRPSPKQLNHSPKNRTRHPAHPMTRTRQRTQKIQTRHQILKTRTQQRTPKTQTPKTQTRHQTLRTWTRHLQPKTLTRHCTPRTQTRHQAHKTQTLHLMQTRSQELNHHPKSQTPPQIPACPSPQREQCCCRLLEWHHSCLLISKSWMCVICAYKHKFPS
ncbi:uncharacterized protein LOC143293959 [Babylonia areolata]|uniref:uncharacterized protein LOC143293959 n=1 Tax=Babylonia areolata TaxID=304850 RepID=UPI003FD52568